MENIENCLVENEVTYSEKYVRSLRRNLRRTQNENQNLIWKVRIQRVVMILLLFLMMFIIIYNHKLDTECGADKTTQQTFVVDNSEEIQTESFFADRLCGGITKDVYELAFTPTPMVYYEAKQEAEVIYEEKEIVQSSGEPNMIDGYYISYIIDDACATAYDLSVQSCGKTMDDEWYGITASGNDISNMSREEAMCIAVDRNIIPLGTKVYVEFKDEAYAKYNGVYTAMDTGSAIKGNKIDIFMGDFQSHEPNNQTIEFGVTDCTLTILSEERMY